MRRADLIPGVVWLRGGSEGGVRSARRTHVPSPVQVPVPSPVQSPVPAPVQTPVQAPVPAPVQVPGVRELLARLGVSTESYDC